LDGTNQIVEFEKCDMQSLLSYKKTRPRQKPAISNQPRNGTSPAQRVTARDKNARFDHAQRVWTAWSIEKDPTAGAGIFRCM
jgi:hypothetical protein